MYTILDFIEANRLGGSDISWVICKSFASLTPDR